MPLIQGKSKKSLSKNIETEMHAGKPQKQSIAIAFDVQRKNKRKKMAYGGKAEATNEPKEIRYSNDHDDMRPAEDEYMSDHEQMLAKGGMLEKQGYGGKNEEDMEPMVPKRKSDDMRPAREDYMSGSEMDKGELSEGRESYMRPPEEDYMSSHERMLAHGGMLDDEEDKHADSVAEAILAKKRKSKMMADGGEVDLDLNAIEEPNNLDDMNYNALRKENYAEEHGLSALSQPENSNEHADVLHDEDEHDGAKSMKHAFPEKGADMSSDGDDMISSIRRRMKSKRQ